MDSLHEDVILIIFDYLDDESTLNVLLAFDNWTRIFANSSKHMSNFTLHLNAKKSKNLPNPRDLPSLPIRNISIDNSREAKTQFKQKELLKLIKIIDTYKSSIQSIKLSNFTFKSEADYQDILKNLKELKSITFDHCTAHTYHNNYLSDVQLSPLDSYQHLKSIKLIECHDELFRLFHLQRNIEEVTIVRMGWGDDFSWADFDEMICNFEMLKCLVMKGHGTANYFEHGGFPFKIVKLDAFLMTFYWQNRMPRIRFLESQKGHLKELHLEKLPYDFDGGDVLKYMIEEMKFETFYYGKIPLILGGKKHDVKEFPTITKFSLFLTQTGLDTDSIGQIINPRTTLFANCMELEIEDSSNYETLLTMFIGLYKNFRNIRKLTIITPDIAINSVLENCLPEFLQLNEIYLKCKVPNCLQRFQFIRDFTPNVRKLSVNQEFVDDAKQFFGDDVQIFAI